MCVACIYKLHSYGVQQLRVQVKTYIVYIIYTVLRQISKLKPFKLPKHARTYRVILKLMSGFPLPTIVKLETN
jgi:hypothetical protein